MIIRTIAGVAFFIAALTFNFGARSTYFQMETRLRTVANHSWDAKRVVSQFNAQFPGDRLNRVYRRYMVFAIMCWAGTVAVFATMVHFQ